MTRTRGLLEATFPRDLVSLIAAYHWDKSRDLLSCAEHGEWEVCFMYNDTFLCRLMFMRASVGGYVELARVMLEQWNPENREHKRNLAYKRGDLAVVRMFLALGVTKYPNNGLTYACAGGNVNAIELAIEQGANDWNGGLKVAIDWGNRAATEMMIARGAQLLLVDSLTRSRYSRLKKY